MSDSKYSMFFGLVKKARLAGLHIADHHELVREHTHGRTESLGDLSWPEYLELCGLLRSAVNPKAAAADKMRKKLIGILRGCGYTDPATGRANMPAIHAWVLKYGHLHVPLGKYAYEELPTLVYQAEQFQHSYVQKLSRK